MRNRLYRQPKAGVPELASLTEITRSPLVNANTLYSMYNLSLSSLKRAQDVARGYQFYRIKRVTFILTPLVDTFTQITGPTTASVPYLYYMIDRVRQFVNGVSPDQLRAMGAKPRRLDDKILKFSLTPSVLTDTFDNTAGASAAVQYKLKPWLPCKDPNSGVGVWNPSTTDHTGIVWIVQQVSGNAVNYSVERRVEVEFKKPATPTTTTGDEQVPIEFDKIEPPVTESIKLSEVA